MVPMLNRGGVLLHTHYQLFHLRDLHHTPGGA
jgi:hypothetical protein